MKTLKEILTENTTIEKKLNEEHLFHEPHHLGAIEQYTSSSRKLNSALWENHVNNKPIGEHHQNRINSLDEVTNLHKTTEPMNVYSKSKHDPREKANSEGIMNHPAFLSTSTRKNVAEQFENHQSKINNQTDNLEFHHHLYNIHVPSGSHGAYVENYSTTPKEHEFILPRGTKLKHIRTVTKQDDFDSDLFFHEHHMEVVQ